MGTNFYLTISYKGESNHIGKRSAAGWFCWDCEVPLTLGGKRALVHSSADADHVDVCPTCGQGKADENQLEAGPAGVELGFAQPRTTRPTGVRGAASFTWAQEPSYIVTLCKQHKDATIIEDEYGRVLTGQAFLEMLENNCPIQFTDSIGRDFS